MLGIIYAFFIYFILFLAFAFIFRFKSLKILLSLINMIILLTFILNEFNGIYDPFCPSHPLCKNNNDSQEYNYINKLEFNPISSFEKNNISNNIGYSIGTSSPIYSIKNISDYSKECINNYFIKDKEICPITEIIIENKKNINLKDYKELKINDTFYLYYTNNKKNGVLYKMDDEIYKFKKTDFDSNKFKQIKKKEDNKFSNPIYKYKNYISYSDCFCYILFNFYYYFSYYESAKEFECSIFKIINSIVLGIILILNLIRYSIFITTENFLVNNDEIYKYYEDSNKDSEKVFDLKDFTLVVAISLLIINYILFKIKKNVSLLCKTEDISHTRRGNFLLYLFGPILIPYILFFIIDFLNDEKIFEKHNSLIYNWDSSPISSINLSQKPEYILAQIRTHKNNYKIYNWKNKYFSIEKLSNFNYINIYKDRDGKICGKDSFGNNLYFPKNIECPINDIVIDNSNNSNYQDYTELNLGNGKSLYYTNKKTNGKIVIDIYISYKSNLELNLKESNELCYLLYKSNSCKEYFKMNSKKFFNKIDEWSCEEFINTNFNGKKKPLYNYNIYLYSINYLGINSNIIKEKSKIHNYKKKMKLYRAINIFKMIMFGIIVFNIFFNHTIFTRDIQSLYIFIISMIYLILLIIFIILMIIGSNVHNKYIANLMEKINDDFGKHKNQNVYNNLMIFFGIIIFVYYFLLYLIYYYLLKDGLIYKKLRKKDNIIKLSDSQNIISLQKKKDDKINRTGDNNNINNVDIIQKKDDINIIKVNKWGNIDPNHRYRKLEPIKKDADNKMKIIKFNNDNNITNIDLNNNNINNLNNIENEINSSSRFKVECLNCSKKKNKITFIPCGHRCICKECYDKLKNKRNQCPICGKQINSIQKEKWKLIYKIK